MPSRRNWTRSHTLIRLGLSLPIILCVLVMVIGLTSCQDEPQVQSSDTPPSTPPPALPIEDDEIKIEEDESSSSSSSDGEVTLKLVTPTTTTTPNPRPTSSTPKSSSHSTALVNLYKFISATSEVRRNQQNRSSSESAGAGVTSTTTNKPVKAVCLSRQLLIHPENGSTIEPVVEIVNFTRLTQFILTTNTTIKTKSTPANCTLIYFHSHWCKFSAKAAPHVNALARVFPSIQTVAIDCSATVSSHFGVLAVPSLLLFHNGKMIAKFNETTFSLTKFAEFIQIWTDQTYDKKLLNVTSKDFQGPLSSSPIVGRDPWLLIAWTFILICFIYFTSRSVLWRRVVDLVRTTWREAAVVGVGGQGQPPAAGQQHEHLD